MGTATKIEWCDHTFNPWRGCTKVAAGCANCYADAQAKRNPSVLGIWGANGTRVVASEAMWKEPLKWNRAAAAEGVRKRVFCASLADVFEEWTGDLHDHEERRLWCNRDNPNGVDGYMYESAGYSFHHCRPLRLDDVRARLFALIDATPDLDWLLVTKRPENIKRIWVPYGPNAADGEMDEYRPNVWLLTSIACQEDAERNIPKLLECRDLCPVLGVSAEPILGPIDLRGRLCHWTNPDGTGSWFSPVPGKVQANLLDWVIVGGESGPQARPCDVAWIRSIVEQCATAMVACFVKQDYGPKPGMQGRLPDDIWNTKEYPNGISRH